MVTGSGTQVPVRLNLSTTSPYPRDGCRVRQRARTRPSSKGRVSGWRGVGRRVGVREVAMRIRILGGVELGGGRARVTTARVAVLGFAALLGVIAAPRAPAAADDPAPGAGDLPTKVSELEARLKEHVAAKAAAALLEDAHQATLLHKLAGEAAVLKKRLLAVHETVLRSVKEDREREKVFEELVSTGDPAGGRLLKPYLKQPNVKEADSLLLAAIKAAGVLACPENADPLLLVFEKSKHLGAAAAALEALGGFREVKSRREKILETVAKSVQQNMPGTRPGPRGPGGGVGDPVPDTGTPNPNGSDASARWAALAPVLPRALNHLTGRSIATAEQWFLTVRQVDRLAELFAS